MRPHSLAAMSSSLMMITTLVMIVAAVAGERRLGSPPLGGQSEQYDDNESSLFWGRLLESTVSSMPLAPSAAPISNSVYLGIGDSLCTGQLPEPKNQILFSDLGYTDKLFAYLETSNHVDALTKVCCPGEDSHELINGTYDRPPSDGSHCYGKDGQLSSQLEAATQAIQNGNVEFITISIGANDIFPCVEVDDPGACAALRIAQLVSNLAIIVPTILQALGESTPPIIAMTPYNPILSYSLSDDPAERALVPISQQAVVALHVAVTENVYEPFGIPVVGALDVFDGLNNTLVDGVPQSVVSVCEYTGMCRKAEDGDYVLNAPMIRDIHPTPFGYETLANAHIAIVEQLGLV